MKREMREDCGEFPYCKFCNPQKPNPCEAAKSAYHKGKKHNRDRAIVKVSDGRGGVLDYRRTVYDGEEKKHKGGMSFE